MNEINVPPPSRSKTIIVTSDRETFSRLFREGEIVSGKVIGQFDDRHVILRLKGQSLLVETRVPLSDQGERMFRIEATSPQVMLKLLPETPGTDSPADWLKRYLSYDVTGEHLTEDLSGLWKTGAAGFPSEIRETVEFFLKFLQTFSFERIPTSASLNELVGRSGLFFEHTLKQRVEGELKGAVQSLPDGDLKELLLRLKSQLISTAAKEGSKGDAVLETLGKGVDQFIHKIELFQLLNLSRPDPQEKLFLFLPLWFENHAEFLELNISLPRRSSKGEEESLSLHFSLHLPNLGRMAIEANVREKRLYCLFRVAETEVAKAMASFLPELETRLTFLGFQSHLRVAEEPFPGGNASLVNEVGEDLKSLISIVV